MIHNRQRAKEVQFSFGSNWTSTLPTGYETDIKLCRFSQHLTVKNAIRRNIKYRQLFIEMVSIK